MMMRAKNITMMSYDGTLVVLDITVCVNIYIRCRLWTTLYIFTTKSDNT